MGKIKLPPVDIKLLKDDRNFIIKDENGVKKRVKAYMLSLDAMLLDASVNYGEGIRGASDQKYLMPSGTLVAIEVKWDVMQRKGPTATQTAYLRDVKSHSGLGLVIDRCNLFTFTSLFHKVVDGDDDRHMLRLWDIEWCPTETIEVKW